MNTQTVMQQFSKAFNQMEIDALGAHLSESLKFHGSTPQPLGKVQFIGMLNMLRTAFPDIQMNIKLIKDEGDTAAITSAMQGTHTGDLNMTGFGMGVIPPTGKSFQLPVAAFDYKLANGLIVDIHAQPNPGGGFDGIFAQLGLGK